MDPPDPVARRGFISTQSRGSGDSSFHPIASTVGLPESGRSSDWAASFEVHRDMKIKIKNRNTLEIGEKDQPA
jgi:hypothetical protein